MEIVLFTMGTRGDVQPYIFLAQALQARGHRVVIGSHPCWSTLVLESGVEFAPVGKDIQIEYEAAKIRGRAKNPMISMLKTMQFIFKIIEESTDSILENCKGKDLVIVSHSLMGATEAEVLGIPTVNVVLQTQMIPEAKKEPGFKDKLFSALVGPQMVRPYNKIRAKYNIPRLKPSDSVLNGALTLIPISKYAVEANPYWDEKNKIIGYWYRDTPGYEPPAEVLEFLRAGEKPIVLALGAMSFESSEERGKLDLFVQAFQQTGHRAIIQGFNETIKNYTLPDTMLHVGSIPHSWLFPNCYAVVHHCGFGTAAAAMLYGIPSIPVPHVLDQAGFADTLHKLDVSTKPVPAGKLRPQAVLDAMRELDANYARLSANAQRLSSKMAMENGLEAAVRLIESVCPPPAERMDG